MAGRTWPLGCLAEHLGARLEGDPEGRIRAIAPLRAAGPGDLSFLSNRRYLADLAATRASAVIVSPRDLRVCPVDALVLDDPYVGYARAAALMAEPPAGGSGIHASAFVDPEACVAADASIGSNAFVGPRAIVGPRARVGPGSVVEGGASIGEDTWLAANVTVSRGVRIGARGIVHPGAVIGADGFGLANDRGVWVKIPQLGGVCIGADVEIGANSTIDRGALEDTVVGDGVKIDNQVQIAHNVVIGPHTAIAGCAAVAGSVRIGARCAIGGGAIIAGHLEIADDVYITGGTAVARSITESGTWSSGMPAQKNTAWRKMWARMQRLDEFARRLRALERDGLRNSSDG